MSGFIDNAMMLFKEKRPSSTCRCDAMEQGTCYGAYHLANNQYRTQWAMFHSTVKLPEGTRKDTKKSKKKYYLTIEIQYDLEFQKEDTEKVREDHRNDYRERERENFFLPEET